MQQFQCRFASRAVLWALFFNLFAATSASAVVIDFSFTGRLTVLDGSGMVLRDPQNAGVFDPVGAQSPIASTLSFDTATGIGSSALTIAPFDFFGGGGAPNTFLRDISFVQVGTTNLFLGNMLADWDGITDIPVSIVWDATGLLNAIATTPGGLQVGDVISGDVVKRGGSTIVASIGSATPATDGIVVSDGSGGFFTINQGPAPIATTTLNTTPLCVTATPGDGSCLGTNPSGGLPFTDDGIAGSPLIDTGFYGINVSFDIGSGDSMTVTAVSGASVVPIPGALVSFLSGAGVLFGYSHRRRARG